MEYLECGTAVGTHGVRGELRVSSVLDDGVLETLETLYIGGAPYRLLGARPHKRQLLVRLEGVETVEQAMALKGRPVSCDRAALSLPPGHYLYGDLYGFQVYDQRVGRPVGVLESVRESPAGMLYVVRDGQAEVLIPAVDAFKRGVDFEGRRVLVETIPGMLPHEN